MSDPHDLTGTWSGTFRYPARAAPDTPFLARIEEGAGQFAGSIIEPNAYYRGETAVATISGHRNGLSVDFTKFYHGAGEEYDCPVDYIGRLSEDGNAIAGVWSLLEWDGTFEMFRDESVVLPVEADLREEEPITHRNA